MDQPIFSLRTQLIIGGLVLSLLGSGMLLGYGLVKVFEVVR